MINFNNLNKNHLTTQIPEKAYKAHIALLIVLCIIFIIIGQVLGSLITPFLKIEQGSYSESINTMLDLVFNFGMVAVVIFFWLKFFEKRSFKSLGFFKHNWLSDYGNGFLLGTVAFCSIAFLLWISGNTITVKPLEDTLTLNMLLCVMIVLIGWIVQGAVEEILTRGWLFQMISERYSINWGILVSSVLFGLLHLTNSGTTFISTLNICLVGFLFIIYALYQQSLWGVCGFHSVWNFLQGNVFGFEVSGTKPKGGSLIELKEAGNDFITGGAFGPEASIIASLLLALLTVFYFKKLRLN